MTDYSISRFKQSVIVRDKTKQGLPKLLSGTFQSFDLKETSTTSVEKESVNLVEIISQEDHWLIAENSATSKVLNLGDLAYFLSDRIIYNLIKNNTVGNCLHAACVARDGKAIVMPAESGAGKSSLTCWFLANGFDYVSDELVILLNDGSMQAVPRPVQIKKAGVDVITPLKSSEATLEQVIEGEVANSYAPNYFGSKMSDLSSWKLSLLLFPKYASGTSLSFDEMSKASAAKSMMGAHVNARGLQDHGFRAISDIAKQTPAYQLEYGGYQYLENDFLDLVEEHIGF